MSAVSRVFNNYGDISEETRKKVYQAAQILDYTPNNAARQLSSKKKRIIALILNEINVTPGVAMPLEILGGVNDYLDKTDYEFVFYATNSNKQKQKSLKQFCSERDISGLIIQGLRVTDPYYEELKNFPLPVVAIDLLLQNEKVGSVSIDNQAAAAEVTTRLIKAGAQNVLFVNGTKEAIVSQLREKGYRSATRNPKVIYAEFSEEFAYKMILNYPSLESVDAIFAASDLMAIGIIKALRERNINKKIAIVGFDDITLASYITPTLTTVRQDIKKISQEAAKDLLLQIEHGEIKKHTVPYAIIVRESADI